MGPDGSRLRLINVKQSLALALALLVVAGACASSESTSPTPIDPAVTEPITPVGTRLPASLDDAANEWAAGVNAAGWEFHKTLDGNAVSSPLSIGLAFSLARAGASPDSGAVLDEIFGFDADPHSAANAIDQAIAKTSDGANTVTAANRLFPNVGFTPLAPFLETASSHYGATIQPVDTSNGADAAAQINAWVSETTRGLIPTIVSPENVQDTELTLVNTVYLKADWATPFLAELTSDQVFKLADGSKATVPFMRDFDPTPRRFVDLGNADAVELNYVGDQLAMWLIVPHEEDGLAQVEDSLSVQDLMNMDAKAREGTVQLTMPKWEFTLEPADLFGWLCPKGFCAGAGFDQIAPDLFIGSAVHSAKVIVDEKGTEAAAATALSFEASGPPPPDLNVVADHPFLWTIVHKDTGAILFVGRVNDPSIK